MKKIKKLTALVATAVLAVGAVPTNIYASDVYDYKSVCDWNNSGSINFLDGLYFVNYMEYIENRPITDFSMYEIDIENYIKSEGGIEEINSKRDLNDDGVIDKRDFVIFGQLSRDYADYVSYQLVNGDVNQDGGVDAVDGYMLKYYFEDLEDGYEDCYSGTQISLFNYRGDANEDGVVDMTDADFILNGGYDEKLHSYFLPPDPNRPVAKVSFDEYMNDDSDSGDVNHDGFVDAVDASIVSCFYAYLSTRDANTKDDNVAVIEVGEDGQIKDLTDVYNSFFDYTEEQFEDMYAYGDVNKDECVNAIDASLIMNKYARNSVQQ